MLDSKTVVKILDWFLFPGLILHEFAHALMVSLNPSSKITDIKLSVHDGGHVEYEYSFMTITRAFLINYAPFYVNTGVSVYLIVYIMENTASGILPAIKVGVLYILAVSFAAKAMPSEIDAFNHIKLMREQLFTRRFIVIVLLSPMYLLLSIPGIVVSKVRSYSVVAYYSVSIVYALVVLALTMATQLGYIDPVEYINTLIDTYSTEIE